MKNKVQEILVGELPQGYIEEEMDVILEDELRREYGDGIAISYIYTGYGWAVYDNGKKVAIDLKPIFVSVFNRIEKEKMMNESDVKEYVNMTPHEQE